MAVPSVVIIIPVLNDGRSLSILIQDLARHLSDRSRISLLVVDDGSLPPLEPCSLASNDEGLPGQIVTLYRNLGHQKAIAIGLAYAVSSSLADIIVVMDADGEDLPSNVSQMLTAVETAPELSVTVATRVKRSERLTFRFFYQLYRLVFWMLTGQRISFGNFSAMRFGAARRLINMSELWLSYPATILRSGLPRVELPMERGHRYRDEPRMNVVSLVTLGFGAVSVFFERVLTRVILVASALIGFCLLASILALILKVIGLATPGWVTTVIGICLIVLLGVGILAFVGLALGFLAGPHTVQTPATLYALFVARISKFGSGAETSKQHRAGNS